MLATESKFLKSDLICIVRQVYSTSSHKDYQEYDIIQSLSVWSTKHYQYDKWIILKL